MKLISKKTLVLFFAPGMLFMGLFLIYPIIQMAFDSFFTFDATGVRSFIGLNNYIQALTTESFIGPLQNTAYYIAFAVSVELLMGFFFALLLENEFKGGKIIRALLLTPLMIAPLVAGLIWRLMFSGQFGIINQMLMNLNIIQSSSDILWLADERIALIACCVADIWLTTPFIMLMLFAGLQGMDQSMLEAARIDGANVWKEIICVKLPVLKPILLATLSVRIIDAARTFDIIWAMTQGGPNRSSEVISIIIYKTLTRYNKPGYASAMAILFVIVLVVFTLVFMQSLWNPKKRGA